MIFTHANLLGMASMILTAESPERMSLDELLEAYVTAVLRGDEDSDFALAARRALADIHDLDARDIDDEIDLALKSRLEEAARRERLYAHYQCAEQKLYQEYEKC